MSGASVPKALIEVGAAPAGAPLAIEADRFGKGEFELPMGSYRLLVKSPGFCPYKSSVEVLQQQTQIVTAKLQVDSCPGPCQASCIAVYPDPAIQTTQSPLRHIILKVNDSTGAPIRGARIQIDHSSGGAGDDATTGRDGEAALNLTPGPHVLAISARLFKLLTQQVEVRDAPNQEILAVMEMDCEHTICDIVITADNEAIPLDQRPAKTTLTIVVTDQSGAIIPGAYIVATNKTTGSRIEAFADKAGDKIGQAAVRLDEGTYDLTVQSKGFKVWEERAVEVKAEMHKAITLALPFDNLPLCGPCVVLEPVIIPLEHQPITAAVPLIPVQQFIPPARPFRPRPPSHRPNPT